MSLHRKCVIRFIFLCTLLCATRSFGNDLANNNVGGDSGEDENLKEALLLVELLKNEYTRALRENFILRQRGDQATTEPPEEPTCASTTASSVTVRSSTEGSRATTSQQPATTTRAISVRRNLRLINPFHSNLTRRKAIQNVQINKNFRRRMPSNYVYGTGALRSLRREEEVSEVPAARESPAQGTESETATADSDAPTNPPEPDATTTANKTDAMKSENPVNTRDDPVLKQVADELRSVTESNQQQQMSRSTTPGRTRRTTRNTRYLSAIKATLKIHLSKSTRLAVPLSKNNAFCYYNPMNSLCRASF